MLISRIVLDPRPRRPHRSFTQVNGSILYSVNHSGIQMCKKAKPYHLKVFAYTVYMANTKFSVKTFHSEHLCSKCVYLFHHRWLQLHGSHGLKHLIFTDMCLHASMFVCACVSVWVLACLSVDSPLRKSMRHWSLWQRDIHQGQTACRSIVVTVLCVYKWA